MEQAIKQLNKIKLTITGTIRIEGLTGKEKLMIMKTLQLVNPLWHKLKAMGSPAVYATPQFFKYYRIEGETLVVPRGVRKRLIGWFGKMGREYTVEEKFVKKSL